MKRREITARSAQNRTRMRDDHSTIIKAIFRGDSTTSEEATLEHIHRIGLDLISTQQTFKDV